jgi:type IV pilus assembly protein PilV
MVPVEHLFVRMRVTQAIAMNATGAAVPVGRRRQRGFSLIETMVATVVLSIGLLGLAAMQQIATDRNMGANDMTLATNLGTDMLDRIRFSSSGTNKTATLVAYHGINLTSSSNNCPSGTAIPISVTGDCNQWQARLIASRLPNVRGTVSVAASGPSALAQYNVTVSLTWKTHLMPMTFSTVITLG